MPETRQFERGARSSGTATDAPRPVARSDLVTARAWGWPRRWDPPDRRRLDSPGGRSAARSPSHRTSACPSSTQNVSGNDAPSSGPGCGVTTPASAHWRMNALMRMRLATPNPGRSRSHFTRFSNARCRSSEAEGVVHDRLVAFQIEHIVRHARRPEGGQVAVDIALVAREAARRVGLPRHRHPARQVTRTAGGQRAILGQRDRRRHLRTPVAARLAIRRRSRNGAS